MGKQGADSRIKTDRKTVVMADSCCDIPKKVAERYGIRILPVHIIYPEKDYLDGIDIDPTMIYDRYPKEYPNTSMPSFGETLEFLQSLKDEGYSQVIAVSVSDHLSSTVNTIQNAAQEFRDMDIFVFNTKNISIGSGIFAIWAADMLRRGKSFEEIKRRMPEKIRDSHLMFYMDTLDYLKKGGRIGNVVSLAANLLKLKPIISCDEDGVYYTVAKIRGERKGKERLLQEVTKASGKGPAWIAVMHGGAPEECRRMEDLVSVSIPNAEFIVRDEQITASLAANTGPGLIGMLVFNDP